MKTAIISASHRASSRSVQVASWVEQGLRHYDIETDLFELSEIDFPFWSEDFWNPESEQSLAWKPYSERLQKCQAIIIISPEWAGMIPPKLGNFLLLCSGQELAYKPTLLIGVSAGQSGTYPIVQMRTSCGKNNQMIYLPDHLIIRNTKNFLEPAPEAITGSALDPESHLNRRLKYNLEILQAMAHDLEKLRQAIDLKAYPYGL